MTLYEHRLGLAREIAERLLERYGGVIVAIGVHGSMARGPDAVDRRSDIDLLVVTDAPDAISEREVFVGDVFVSMGVNTARAILEEADQVRWDWAIASEQFVNTLVLHDPTGFFERVNVVHERAVERMTPAERIERSQGLVLGAKEWLVKGDRAVESGSSVPAYVCLVEALIVLAFAIGLCTQTRWTGSQLAVAAAARAGRDVAGFSDAYAAASEETTRLPDRLHEAHRACDALRSYFDQLGAISRVGSVGEFVM